MARFSYWVITFLRLMAQFRVGVHMPFLRWIKLIALDNTFSCWIMLFPRWIIQYVFKLDNTIYVLDITFCVGYHVFAFDKTFLR